MPARWKEWEKAKQDMKTESAAKSAAVDEALGILRGAQKASRENPNVMHCPECGGVKFKTLNKGLEWACRACGRVVRKNSEAP